MFQVIQEKRQLRRQNRQNPKISLENHAEGQKSRKAFMDYLLDLSGADLSNTQIRNEVDTFMAAVGICK